MQIVHFTEAATDPVEGFCAHGVRCVPLADGAGAHETYVSCIHIEPSGWISDPPALRDSTLLVVHGEVTLWTREPTVRFHLSSGVGLVMSADCRFKLESATGAIVIVVEAERLEATGRGISEPERIMGARWPDERDPPEPRRLVSVMRRIYYRVKWSRPVRRVLGVKWRLVGFNMSGWWPPSAPTEGSVMERVLYERRRNLR